MGVFLFGWNGVDDDIIVGFYRKVQRRRSSLKKRKRSSFSILKSGQNIPHFGLFLRIFTGIFMRIITRIRDYRPAHSPQTSQYDGLAPEYPPLSPNGWRATIGSIARSTTVTP